MALRGHPVPRRHGTPGDTNPFLGVANPALEREISPPLHALAADPVPADVAYQLVHDELILDGNARLNLATFVTTWMEPQARALMDESVAKNMIDKDEYPQTAEIENRCVAILADLWNAPDAGVATGCSTTGSREAAMLAGLARKWRWRARQRAAGQPPARPNLVLGAIEETAYQGMLFPKETEVDRPTFDEVRTRKRGPVKARTAAQDGSIERLMQWHKVKAGDFFYIPAGTVHAIGAGISLIEMAIAFVMRHPAGTAPIIGPRTMEHLESQLAAADVVLTDDVLDRIDEIVPPGVTLNPADNGWVSPSLAPAARRR